MPHGCSLSLHETSCNKMHMPHDLTPKWIGLKFPDISISTAQYVFVRHAARWQEAWTDVCHCLKEPMAVRSLDFHPNIFNCFHELYPLTFIIYSLAAFAACLLFLVYIWVLSGSINLSECCQLLPIWIPKPNITGFRFIRKRIWSYFQNSLSNFCHGYQGEQITWRSPIVL